MKFIDQVRLSLTGERKSVSIPLTTISEDFKSSPYPSEYVGYEIRLAWGFGGYAPSKELTRVKESAIKQLKHQLYGELKNDLLELQRNAFDAEWETVRNNIGTLMEKLDF